MHVSQYQLPTVYVSNTAQKDTGHSAILDPTGTKLWLSGCDRWQQLGLGGKFGSGTGGDSGGYTWEGGKLWRTKFTRSISINEAMGIKTVDDISSSKNNGTMTEIPSRTTIRDVALGSDHTLVLSSNQRDVFAFGRCGNGQCGFIGKPYVSSPKKSAKLSTSSNSNNKNKLIAAICAIESCSVTIGSDGDVIAKVGKCRGIGGPSSLTSSSSMVTTTAEVISNGIEQCIHTANRRGLI